jgi:hypothetical protein
MALAIAISGPHSRGHVFSNCFTHSLHMRRSLPERKKVHTPTMVAMTNTSHKRFASERSSVLSVSLPAAHSIRANASASATSRSPMSIAREVFLLCSSLYLPLPHPPPPLYLLLYRFAASAPVSLKHPSDVRSALLRMRRFVFRCMKGWRGGKRFTKKKKTKTNPPWLATRATLYFFFFFHRRLLLRVVSSERLPLVWRASILPQRKTNEVEGRGAELAREREREREREKWTPPPLFFAGIRVFEEEADEGIDAVDARVELPKLRGQCGVGGHSEEARDGVGLPRDERQASGRAVGGTP